MNNDYMYNQLTALEEQIEKVRDYIIDDLQHDHTKPFSLLYNYNTQIQQILVHIKCLKRPFDTRYYTNKEIKDLQLYLRHYTCGGGWLYEIGTVQTGYCDVPLWKCKKCGEEIYATEYEEFCGYYARKYTKEELHKQLPLIFNTIGGNIMKFRPLHDRVLIKRQKEKEMTKGGIIIPEMGKEKPSEGQVVAVGTGKVLEDGSIRPMNVKVQDTVLFGKYAGTDITIDDVDYIILKEDDILGVLAND